MTKKRRTDIQGLRAIAVVLVLVWHAGIPGLQAGFVGVDVFFVISGYLMTQLLYTEGERRGRIAVGKFYAKRACRLVPAALLVLIVVAVATFTLLPSTRWKSIGLDIGASGTYVVNWLLAERSIDYLAHDSAPSPLQHYWSLAVEEQFYLVWPLLILLAFASKRAFRVDTRLSMLIVALTVGSASLIWSAYYSGTSPEKAYFVTTTRVWELMLGATIALAAPVLARVTAIPATLMSWLGLAGIIASATLITDTVAFPGLVALVPTLSCALVIAGGVAGRAVWIERVLGIRVVQRLGDWSYSLYLWHWPVLVIGGYVLTEGLRPLSAAEGSALVVSSVLPAWLSYRYVEDPLRVVSASWRAARSLTMAGAAIAAAAVCGVTLILVVPANGISPFAGISETSSKNPESEPLVGALSLTEGAVNQAGREQGAEIYPHPAHAKNDNPAIYEGCHQPAESSEPVGCSFGDPASSTRVVLVGDSHAAQWFDAVRYVAEARDWYLTSYTKSSCPLVDKIPDSNGAPYSACVDWNRNIQDVLSATKPDIVFVSSLDITVYDPGHSEADSVEQKTADMTAGLKGAWKRIIAGGADLIVLADTPRANVDVADCVAGHLAELSACATHTPLFSPSVFAAQKTAADETPGTTFLDLTSWICPDGVCPAVIGGIIIYRDSQHMTASYSRSLGPILLQQIERSNA